MKNLTRNSLTAVALAGLLGLTGCGISQPIPGDGSSEQAATEQQQQENSTKPVKWVDSFKGEKGFPSEWNEGAGWSASVDSKTVKSLGEYVSYVDQHESKVFIVDRTGEKKFVSGADEEFDGSTTEVASVISKNGKDYIVVSQYGTSKPDPTSVKKSGPKSIVHVFDHEMKEVWKKDFPSYVLPRNDALIVNVPQGEVIKSVVNVATGDLEVLAPPAGYKWVGAFDSTNIYALAAATETGGELTNGVWKVPTAKTMELNTSSTELPTVFGNVLSVKKPGGKECDLINPESGEVLELGASAGACITEVISSPDGNYVFFSGDKNVDEGIISLSGKRIYSISEDISFTPKSITNDGVVYGISGNGSAVFDFNKDTEPKKVPEVKQVPILVAKNGIAVFGGGEFVVKK